MKYLLSALCLISCQAGALTFTTENFPPVNFSTDGGKTVTGSSAEIIKEMLRRTGHKATITLHPWRLAYKLAQDDAGTCVFSTSRTEVRENKFKWVGPLATTQWILYARADSPISAKSLDELKPYIIGSYHADARAIYLKEKGFTVDEANTEQQSLKKLAAGRVDLWAATDHSGLWNARLLGIKIKPVITFKETQLFVACNPAVPDADITAMNAALKAMHADGTVQRLTAPYR